MNVTLELYALLGHNLAPNSRDYIAELVVNDEHNVMDVIHHLNLPVELCHLVLLDGFFVPPGERETCILRQSDARAIWPEIAGG